MTGLPFLRYYTVDKDGARYYQGPVFSAAHVAQRIHGGTITEHTYTVTSSKVIVDQYGNSV
mgnify:CR=1 FL=1